MAVIGVYPVIIVFMLWFSFVCDVIVPCWCCVSAVIFICDGRIGLCCVYLVFLVAYPYEFINRDVDAYKWAGECSGARALTDS